MNTRRSFCRPDQVEDEVAGVLDLTLALVECPFTTTDTPKVESERGYAGPAEAIGHRDHDVVVHVTAVAGMRVADDDSRRSVVSIGKV